MCLRPPTLGREGFRGRHLDRLHGQSNSAGVPAVRPVGGLGLARRDLCAQTAGPRPRGDVLRVVARRAALCFWSGRPPRQGLERLERILFRDVLGPPGAGHGRGVCEECSILCFS